jgi:LmbE family N-acetylglucosaminyl deacetylase
MSTSPLEMSVSLLAFGAHPDDVEFGCGGVIARETRAGRTAHMVIGSRGEAASNGTPEQRSAEAQKGASLLGATVEFIDLGGDAHFECRVEHVIKLAAIIRRVRPAIVLAPSVVENQHPDHAALGRMVRDATRLARFGGVAELTVLPPHTISALLFYAVSADAEPRDVSPVFIDVSTPEVITAWTAAIAAHASQARTRDYAEMVLTRAHANGLRCGVRHAVPLFPNDPPVFDSLEPLARAVRRY